MKEAFVSEDLKVHIRDSPIPELTAPDHILIKVVVSGCNPKDWKVVSRYPSEAIRSQGGANTGDDIAGIVEKVGPAVYEFKPGDRVAAFHEMMKPGGSFAEYAVAYQHATFHIPPHTSFEEAAALPLAAMTAAIGMYRNLGLPQPWDPPSPSLSKTPLIIYGASSAVGFYALQFAIRSGIHPLLCVAGRAGRDYIAPFLDPSKGDVLVDYRDGDSAVVDALTAAAASSGQPIMHAFDAVSEHGSPANIARVFASNPGTTPQIPKVTFVLFGPKPGLPTDGSVQSSITMVNSAHYTATVPAGTPSSSSSSDSIVDEKEATRRGREFAHVYFRYISLGLAQGWFRGQRTEVIPGGLGGIQTALENLKAGKASGVKYVFRIGETEGVSSKQGIHL